MKQLKWMFNGALLTLIFCLALTLTILVISEMQTVRADVVIQPGGVTVQENTDYARLLDAPPQRDITAQRFAPLEVK
ncbi:MAG: hypothetical protein BroJett011_00520 [Chloroflexota bacterium]|nr:MAG: hypothetical protein BroJett011_00520 [Chloroflexota bacterium]